LDDATYDIIVIGCGAAGLSAAVTSIERGVELGHRLRVAVIEVAPKEERGGATRWSGAGLRVNQDHKLDPLWVGRVQEASRGLADLDYCKAFEAAVPSTLRFLEDHGVEIVVQAAELASTYHQSGFRARPNGGGHAIVERLASALDATPEADILYETEAVELMMGPDGSINGVVVRDRLGGLQRLDAKSVILACGGFEGNAEMLTRYVGRNACDLRQLAPGLAFNKGAGIRMAMAIGADTSGQFDMFHGEAVDSRTDRPDAVIYVHPYGIVVNGEGKRFYDEGWTTFDMSLELIAYEIWREQNQTAFFIADQTAMKIPAIQAWCDTDQRPVRAQTIRDLAIGLGLEPEVLEATVAEYNAAVGPGEFDPTRMDGKSTVGLTPPKSNWAYPLENPPYEAYPLTTAITFTFGGLRTDSSARVLSTGGAPLRNLYAAGEIVGVFYHQYIVATSVLRALTFGCIAGTNAATAILEAA
jgi:tricarballylate dehydrogenase